MRTTGFICEFNPLHEGHRYFISEARRASDADCLIALMSGDFVQRGEPSILPMYERTKDALEAGADLVLQMPAVFSTGSAAYFAEGGVRILDALGCVDTLAFGAEGAPADGGDDADGHPITFELSELADFMERHRDELQPLIRRGIRSGLTYAAARAGAVAKTAAGSGPAGLSGDTDRLLSLLEQPNNQLALSYLSALRTLGSPLQPAAIRRDPQHLSSSQIREQWTDGNGPAVRTDDFSLLLRDRVMRQSAEELSAYLDVTPDLAQRIKNRQNDFMSWTQFTDLIHTKEMTRARISRCLAHILLNIRKDDPLLAKGAAPGSVLTNLPSFVRILGFRRSAAPLLAAIKENSSIAVSTRLPLDITDTAADLYETVRSDKYSLPFTESHRQQPVIL